jgi:hypothetical protein
MYVAFVMDVVARRKLDCRVSSLMHADFLLDALEQPLCPRQRGGQSNCELTRLPEARSRGAVDPHTIRGQGARRTGHASVVTAPL